MTFTAKPQQALQIFSMLFGETPEDREPMQSKAMVEKKDREELVRARLLRSEKRGRAHHLVLNDEAWDWAVGHLDVPLSAPKGSPLLHIVLTRLGEFLRQNDHSLAEFVRGSAPRAKPPEDPQVTEGDLKERIRQACLTLTGGKIKERVRLKDLRRRISVPREELDEALLALQRSGVLILMRLDNPAEVTAEDEAAAVDIAGNSRHLLYLEV